MLLVLTTLGHVLGRTDHIDDISFLIDHGFAAGVYDPGGSILPNNAKVVAECVLFFDGPGDVLHYLFAVVLVNPFHVVIKHRLELLRLQSKYSKHLVGPPHFVCRGIPLPAPDVGYFLCCRKL